MHRFDSRDWRWESIADLSLHGRGEGGREERRRLAPGPRRFVANDLAMVEPAFVRECMALMNE